MKYFKNTELAKLYHVSEKSIRNWIQSAADGKLDLQLHEENGKSFVANTPRNTLTLKHLVEKGQKYKNTRSFRVVSPTPHFYEVYTRKQIFDIISSLTIHNELPLQYSYVDGGADYWDKYSSRLSLEEAPNILTRTIELLQSCEANLDYNLNHSKKVNIVDLGPGNGLPIKRLIEHFLKDNRLNRYIAIDISQGMLDITERHVKKWFGDKVRFEGHVRDFSSERFDDLFADDYAGDDAAMPTNLVLLLSGTLCNFRSPSQALQAINNSLGLNDILAYTTKLDTPNSRRYFDLGIESTPRPVDFLFKIGLDLLGLHETDYEVDQYYDEKQRARFVKIRPTVDLSIEFKLANGTRKVHLLKNEPVLLWRYWHHDLVNVIDQFDQNDFNIIQATKSIDQEYLLLVSKIKVGEL